MSVDPRRVAISVLVEVERGGWSDRCLQNAEQRIADAAARRRLHALVLRVLRWQLAIDRRLDPLIVRGLARQGPAVRAALRLGAASVLFDATPIGVAVNDAVAPARQAVGPQAARLVRAVLARLASEQRQPLDPADSLPRWLVDRWITHYGASRTQQLIESINQPPATYVVVTDPTLARGEVLEQLARADVNARACPRLDDGIEVLRGHPGGSPLFQAGRIVAIDRGAALVARLARPDDARPLVDLAAAPGGKALWLAARSRAPLLAVECVASRARLLRERLNRSPWGSRVAVLRADSRFPPLHAAQFGTVVLDAPCSGTGTLRRRPDRRTRVTLEQIHHAARLQTQLLDAAVSLIAPGGALVYAVCSLEPEEGIEQIQRLLTHHRRLQLVEPQRWLGDAAAGVVAGDPPVLLTWPDSPSSEGFVAARMRLI